MKKTFALLLAAPVAALGLLYATGELDGLLVRLRNADPGRIRLYGNVEIRQVLLGFRVSGRIEEVHREEGERVVSGDLLAALDPLPYEIKRTEARGAMLQAKAALDKLHSGFRTGEVREAAAQRDRVRAALNLAEKDYERISNLFARKAVAKNDLDRATSQRNALRAELSAAENALALMREGYRKEDVEAAEAAYETAGARFKAAEIALADTRLYAPAEGTILTRVTEPGTVVGAGQVVYALALERPIQVRAYIPEPALGRVEVGMPARIVTDSHPDEPIEGKLVFISPTAEFTPKQVQTEDLRTDLVYRVRILVEDDGGRLKNGMPVTVLMEASGDSGPSAPK
ncbi:HlyD family efflux transporter periplasmic adaptor subunit [Fretibacterium sp. OH1220_COT-178]|uniref:HlyD family efflux transporter periplasmic adaptor subunit n=1 Tax=Fretibacterium sp. OH1220_COT-178 TaxID=2491047 RepID=UPI000F5EAD5D|nr:HlyD family efflux transporter periplasmic adaptor subunit [Fretibacterium sp. OH1220_COT-178]RRD63696.1 HlyD family efflux transporter periplasmic adaptor subunit [Fretibacterium sp. OH1220_COT-178]